MTAAPQRPGFCPWCGSPIAYEEHEHEPRYESLAQQARSRGEEPPPLPERVRDVLAGESFAGACPGCRTVSHVVGHKAPQS
ncbi:MAG: hypothetical protein H0W05_07130 [Thermoleophilaceae bacterium]|nr:hypothetical protein [Thermoleophilaceae bacterium]